MNILLLGNNSLYDMLAEKHTVWNVIGNVDIDFVECFDFIISYGYRNILKKDILDLFPRKAVNLHISYLPYNKGADPNFWSQLDKTPKGVSIHYMDEGVDTGDIIAQSLVEFNRETDTLASSYDKLQKAMVELFKKNMEAILSGRCPSEKQTHIGTHHYSKDKEEIFNALTNGWETPIRELTRIQTRCNIDETLP